jgi:isoleucyl-tRNA synthetase
MEEKHTKSGNALREEKILQFWREQKIFQKSLEKKSPKGHYVFYDGPPFATGQMHYGHILGSTAKDVIGRYQTMRGYYVPRKWGWDCHGLPIENIVESELGVAGHNEIETLGIDKFVEHARSKVLEFEDDWESGVERIGRWVDFRGGYKTMDNTFIESVWWALSEMNKKKLIYEGLRVLAYCARCETPIANSEIAMDNSYKDIADISIYVKFELEDEPGTYLLTWTTTPWTLPGNTAIAINENIEYVKVKVGHEFLILATETIRVVLKGKEYSHVETFKGKRLLGKKYKPIFPYYEDSEVAKNKNIYKVWHADFVTTEKGTGLAHEAPAFGEDDMNLAKANDIPWIIHVDETGRFKPEVTDFAGLKVKPKDTAEDKDAHLRTDIEVIKYLQATGAFFHKEKIIHSYPHCMRCDTPIIYYALSSWFMNIQKVKKNIQRTGKKINWIPDHLKEGRYNNIVDNAPDWNISRNRYWASPLPIWRCESCKKQTFIDSVNSLQKKAKNSGNKYFVMRHGETTTNLKNMVSTKINSGSHLTAKGINNTKESAQKLKKEKIDLVFVSPFNRTRETAKVVQEELGLKDHQIIVDDRLGEMMIPSFEGKDWMEYHKYIPKTPENFGKSNPGDESYKDVKKRVMDCLFEIEEKHQGKSVLIITHGSPAWLLASGTRMLEVARVYELLVKSKDFHYFKNSEVQPLTFLPFPHNSDGVFDLHRPYIDEIELVCECSGKMQRIPEVLDCWFESGSMPFAQDHYPFENKKWQKNNFPAGFVAEYIAQTRTWFYYTHSVSTILFGKAPFRNVVTTGTLRAEDGEKMSKSKKNYPDPWSFIDKYGVDPLRLYLMSSTLMKGEDSNFSEKGVQEIGSKVISRLFNVLAFYELYRDKQIEEGSSPRSENILDRWILSRLSQTGNEVTEGMESYDMAEATRPLEGFVDDLSTWYLRRSRERIKEGDTDAKKTLYFVLVTFAKIIAPFAPFTGEDIWLRLRGEQKEESVHLAEWPKLGKADARVIEEMADVRNAVSLGLKERQVKNIPVRQPLGGAVLGVNFDKKYIPIIQEELNVKELRYEKSETVIKMNFEITPELKEEGNYRELVRAIQDMRKENGLLPSDYVILSLATDEAGKALVGKFEKELKDIIGAKEIKFEENQGAESKIGDTTFRISIQK